MITKFSGNCCASADENGELSFGDVTIIGQKENILYYVVFDDIELQICGLIKKSKHYRKNDHFYVYFIGHCADSENLIDEICLSELEFYEFKK